MDFIHAEIEQMCNLKRHIVGSQRKIHDGRTYIQRKSWDKFLSVGFSTTEQKHGYCDLNTTPFLRLHSNPLEG